MAISPKLEIRQSQTLVMTPQLQQAIKLLQLSNLELTAFVEQELERNPLLERQDDGEGEPPARADEAPGAGETVNGAADGINDDGTAGDVAAVELDGVTPPDGGDVAGADGPLDTDYENVYNNDSAPDMPPPAEPAMSGLGAGLGAGPGGRDGDGGFGLEQSLSREISLKEHLAGQLNVALSDPADRIVGAHMIECIDEAGYLIEEVATIADRMGCDEGRVHTVLKALQRFDPAGVFARDLGECLALQLRERDRFDPAMQALIENLHLLAEHDIPALMRICRVDDEDMAEMVQEIKALNPKPGLVYDYDVAQPVVPDVFVRENPDGGWMVELNSDTLPRVLVNARYYAEVLDVAKSKDERNYLTDCVNNANWLVKSLDQRARTILKVSTEIVRQQDAFFAHGVQHLRPLNLRTIAEAIDMHESTVSRVTANKYMSTPRGIFELKYFFTAAIQSTAGGDAHSAEAVRHRIRELIDREPIDNVLSDDKLVELLNATGIDIARRTVAKYREAMGIQSSVQRRRMKRLSA